MITNSPEREDASVDDDGRHKRTARLWSGVAAIQPRSEVKFWELGGSERKGGDVTTEAGDVTTEAAAAPEIEASVQTTEDVASVDDDGIIAPAPGIEAAAVQTTEDVASVDDDGIIAPEESEAAITDDASEIEAAVEDDITDDAEGIIELTSEDTEEGAISVDDDGRKKRNGTLMTETIVGKDVTSMEKMWNAFIVIGNIAFAYNNYPVVAIRIQDTLRSGPPENKVMKKASLFGI